MSLAPDADVPEVAPASIGAPLISPEFKGLVMPPGQVAAAYADVLLKGDASEFATMFDPEGDVLREQLGVDRPAGDQRRPAADGRHRVLERRRRAAPRSRSPRTTPVHS